MSTSETPRASTTKVHARGASKPPRPRLTAEQRELASSYMPLARRLARPMKLCFPRYRSEIDSAACYAMVEAAQAYNPDRGVQFATFARMRVIGAVYDAQRRIRAKPVVRGLPNVPRAFRYIPGTEEGAALMLQSFEPDVSDVVGAIERVEVWLRVLPARHASICREIYLNHRSQAEVAAEIGCAKSRVSCIHAEALEILRDSHSVRAAALESGMDVGRN